MGERAGKARLPLIRPSATFPQGGRHKRGVEDAAPYKWGGCEEK
nr:MAG TPA: hypothetical protein [Caudoviricetes sp.]